MQLLSLLANAASDFLAWVAAGLAGVFATVGKVVYGNRSRSRENAEEIDTLEGGPSRLDEHEERMAKLEDQNDRLERYFVGDPNDPSDEGVLQEVHDIHEQVHEEHNNE
jgi:hypothetical protein